MRVLEGLGFWEKGVGFRVRGLRVERFRASWVGGLSRRLLNLGFGVWGSAGLHEQLLRTGGCDGDVPQDHLEVSWSRWGLGFRV